MLNLPIPEKYPAFNLSAEQKRKRLLAALLGWVFSVTKDQPLVIAPEDLHWVDLSTLELVQMIGEQGVTAPLMLLITSRSNLRAMAHAGSPQSNCTQSAR